MNEKKKITKDEDDDDDRSYPSPRLSNSMKLAENPRGTLIEDWVTCAYELARREWGASSQIEIIPAGDGEGAGDGVTGYPRHTAWAGATMTNTPRRQLFSTRARPRVGN